MDYTDVIFNNDMDGAGLFDRSFNAEEVKAKAAELGARANENVSILAAKARENAAIYAAKAKEVAAKAKEEAIKKGEEISKRAEQMWSERDAIMEKLSEEAKENYRKLKDESKVLLDKAKVEYSKVVDNLTPAVNAAVNDIIAKTEEYKNLGEEKLAEVRAKLTEENLEKMRADAVEKYNQSISDIKNKLDAISQGKTQGGDYYSKYMKYKAKYLALKKELESSKRN